MGVYHSVSRVIQRRFVFGDLERERFVEILREDEEFCGVRLRTYCVMSNHFHVLVEVPKRPSGARRMKDVTDALFTARDLRVGVFGE